MNVEGLGLKCVLAYSMLDIKKALVNNLLFKNKKVERIQENKNQDMFLYKNILIVKKDGKEVMSYCFDKSIRKDNAIKEMRDLID